MRIRDYKVSTETSVPQESVLSPQLFWLYIDDLLVKISSSEIIVLAHADDFFLFLLTVATVRSNQKKTGAKKIE